MFLQKLTLSKFTKFTTRKGPLLLVILDGWGVGKEDQSNAIFRAKTPYMKALEDEARKNHLYRTLKAHGPWVGLPSDKDMGNSEVAHNAMGAGRVYDQGAKLVNGAIASKKIFQTPVWKSLVQPVSQGSATLHLIGLLSDGNVHSHIDQLFAILDELAAEGAKRVRIHPLLDGRDVPPKSGLKYIDMLETKLSELSTDKRADYRIASGGGRMRVTMDRYNSDWNVVKRGWNAHVRGIPEHFEGYPGYFRSAREAIETARKANPEIDDQYNPSFVIVDENGQPVGKIRDGDSVIYFNYRGDRAIQISRAFEEKDFKEFDREEFPKVNYAGLLEYDGDYHIPKQYLVSPPDIQEVLTQYLCGMGVHQFAIAETHKFGHVTYFWNGNFLGYIDKNLEEYVEIKSDPSEMIEKKPEMKARGVTDRLITVLNSEKFQFLRVNFANGDMVGHTGNMTACIKATEVLDECVGRLQKTIDELQGIMIVTADHGNLEEKLEKDGSPKTAHTLNPVPFLVHDPQFKGEYAIDDYFKDAGISSIAATILEILGFTPPANYTPALLKFK
ncbi:MAG: phosphoglyceromutase [Promethearchaeota archaeon CR_4]|nr:MAG: phosphoglyceromutase [Candidatus Lokiarchaeota archaeon CR_4]